MLSKVFGLPEVGQESEGRLGSWVCMASFSVCVVNPSKGLKLISPSSFCTLKVLVADPSAKGYRRFSPGPLK